LLAVGLHTCTAVARSLCVSWAFLLEFRDQGIGNQKAHARLRFLPRSAEEVRLTMVH